MTTRELLLAVPLLIGGWLGLLGVVGLLSDDAPAQIVMFPNESFLQSLSPDMAVLEINRWSITVVSDEESLVQKLYDQGALLVLPSGLQGCGVGSIIG